MQKATCIFLLVAMLALASCQLFNDILPPLRRSNAKLGGFQKTLNFDSIKLSDRPGAKNGYLPPEPPTYLPPDISSTSTNGPTYLPPIKSTTTTRIPRTYMPTMNTFPPTRYYNYTTTTSTTHKPMPPPRTLPPIITTRRPTTGYVYDKPQVEFLVEDLRRKGGR